VSASHAQYAHSTAQEPGVQATPNKRQEQRTAAGKGQEPSQDKPSPAKPSQAGWVLGERERGDHRQQSPGRRAAAFQIDDKQVNDT